MAAIAQWRLNGNANDVLALSNGTSTNITWQAGIEHGSAYFNGVSSVINIPSTYFKFPNTTFTVSGWIKAARTSTNGAIMAFNGVTAGWAVFTSGSGYLQVLLKGSGTNCLTAIGTKYIILDNNWHYLCAIITTSTTNINSNNVIMYVDGKLETATGVPTSVYNYNSTDNLTIGRRNIASPYYYKGNIDAILIDNAAWTNNMILNKYLFYKGII